MHGCSAIRNICLASDKRVSSVFVCLILISSGCAQLRLPAIDPTGNRIFLPAPNSTQLLLPGTTRTGGCLGFRRQNDPTNTGVPATVPQPYVAPPAPEVNYPIVPAFVHPADPPPCGAGKSDCHSRKQHLVPDPSGLKSAGQRGEILLTPSRIVAPVGSEVVVLAGICGGDGYFVVNQPLEWMLSNDSAGQLIEVGGMNHPTFNKVVPPNSKKFDGQYAWGRTGLKEILLTRGTPTPVDDIELRKGQTFVSVSSASPGTSYLTAVAPKAEAWDKRRASTVIHWVDGQWSIPLPSSATAGTVHPLTTMVKRSGDGSGVAGWPVRYSIVGGAPAEFAPSGSQTAETVTDRSGEATVQIRQPAGQFDPGTTQVRVDVVRPPIMGEPELIVESGITTVTWSSPALTIRAIGPRTAGVSEAFNYRIEVTNPGDQVARGVVVRTKNLDDAIDFISSTPKPTEYGRQYEWQLGDIVPGSPAQVINVQLKSEKRGNVGMCFEVASESDRLRTEACAETEIAAPCIGLDIEGPTQARLGEEVTFNFNVLNQCDEPLEDIELVIQYDPGLVAVGTGNPIRYTIPSLQFNENKIVPITFSTQDVGLRCFDLSITARGGHTSRARRCVEVLSADGSSASNSSQLDLQLAGGAPMAIGGRSLVEMRLSNLGQTTLNNVTLINRFSDSMEAFELSPEFSYNWLGEELAVSIGDLEPGQTKILEIVYKGLREDGNATTEATASTVSGQSATDSLTIRVEKDAGIDRPFTDPADQPGGTGGGQERPIQIPRDGTGQTGGLDILVQTLDRNIQMADSARPDNNIPSESRVQFTVTNNRSTTDTNVDITLLVPPGIRMVNFNFDQGQLPIVNRNDDFTQFLLQRRLEMRAGEALTFVATFIGMQPGQATFEVQAISDNTIGVATGSDVINIRP